MRYPIADDALSPAQVIQLTNTMLAVALVDGLDPTEAVLIRQFYEDARSDDMLPVEAMMKDLATRQFKLGELIGSSPEFAETLVLMGLMTAYADGFLSQEERDLVNSIAAATGMDAALLAKHLAQAYDDHLGASSRQPISE